MGLRSRPTEGAAHAKESRSSSSVSSPLKMVSSLKQPHKVTDLWNAKVIIRKERSGWIAKSERPLTQVVPTPNKNSTSPRDAPRPLSGAASSFFSRDQGAPPLVGCRICESAEHGEADGVLHPPARTAKLGQARTLPPAPDRSSRTDVADSGFLADREHADRRARPHGRSRQRHRSSAQPSQDRGGLTRGGSLSSVRRRPTSVA